MKESINNILFLFNAKEKKRVFLLLFLILILAFIETIGVASIMPFIAILSNPSIIETNTILKNLFTFLNAFGINSQENFIFFIGIVVFLILISSISFKAFVNYMQLNFVNMQEFIIGKSLIEKYLHQPYSWFLNRNSSEIGKTILSEVSGIVTGCINPLIELVTKSVIVIFILILLLIVDFKLTLICGFTIGIFYGFIFKTIRKILNRLGEETLLSNTLRFKILSEAFGATKEIKLSGLEKKFIDEFCIPAKTFSKNQVKSGTIYLMPRFVIEAIAFGGMMLILLYLISKQGNLNDVLPVITLYAFATYRLVPAIQSIFASLAQLKFKKASLNALCGDFRKLNHTILHQNIKKLSFDKEISLRNISFKYPKSARTIIKNINLQIYSKSTIGIVGPTGSGKTTIVDIILGLLLPQKGKLEVDGETINATNNRSWQNFVGYVPQQIYISDDTIKANIAFGVKPENIDQKSIERAAKIADLHQFIVEDLHEQYQTKVGERGVRLSGGQKQRIGIARALYHKPKLLVFDEATSALDMQTEKIVMNSINKLEKEVTIIIIAHRLNTVKNCDNIIVIDKGEIKEQGKYDQLVKTNIQFKNFT
tara:strand:- start:560 stop:2347 length:1788 start_codon:yes stop_codon:yes gene_type:complete